MHRLTKKLYLETLLLERTFIQKISKAIDTKCIAILLNPITGQITPLVPTILEFLKNNYGRITLQQLDNMTTTIKEIIYDPSQPIYIIFNSIDNLVEYAREAKSELTQIQTINIALLTINRQRIFKDNNRAWKRIDQRTKHEKKLNMTSTKAHLELR